MSKDIKLYIDGKEVVAKKGDTILQAARRNGMYIPTMCYLSKVKPIASCRVCVVEVDGMEGNILSCQEKVIEGIKVTTNSNELFKQRQNILKMYDVNHPLQCGVCDKSGECDLQNKTLEMKLSTQDFSAKEQKRELQNWGSISYDPYLCILCERCVRVSNEIIGDEALKISVGGYNSTIINTKLDEKSIDWGECAEVCPVGALVTTDFKYKANAWELKRVPASCVHTPLANLIYYEVKNNQILRVRSEYEFDTIGGVCRFGYDFENRGKNTKDDLQMCVENFKKADTIRFTSLITNEEALILQRLKEKYGYKLINQEAKNYQNFLRSFSSITGSSLYSGVVDEINKSDFIITFGSRISDDIAGIKFKINEAVKKYRATFYYCHPIEDDRVKNIVNKHIKYEVGSEEGVLALIAKAVINEDQKLAKGAKEFLDSLDEGYLSAESNVGEEEIERLKADLKRKKSPYLIVGSDLYAHPRAKNIAKIIGLIEKYSDFKVIVAPTYVNTLGVSLICDLDDKEGEFTIGYNDIGDFVLSALKDKGDINMPALNQQEGTFTNINKKVVPTYVAISFDGFCLNDIANELGLNQKYTIDYTKELPTSKGFKEEDFDELPCVFTNSGEELRGYNLESKKVNSKISLNEVADIDSYDGVVIYSCNPNEQKNIFTNICKNLPNDLKVVGSSQFAIAAKLKDGDMIEFEIDGLKICKEFRVDDKLKGTVGLLPSFDMGFEGQKLSSIYRYNKINVKQGES